MAFHADASAKIDSESLGGGSTPSPSPSFTPAQVAAAEAALGARGVEEAEHAPRLLAHMAVYAGLRTPLFARGRRRRWRRCLSGAGSAWSGCWVRWWSTRGRT